MNPISNNNAPANSVDDTLDQILKNAQGPKPPSAFRRFVGAAVGIAGNIVAPGAGGVLGNLIGGLGGINTASTDPTQFLRLQQQLQAQSEAFQAASNVLKSKHDSAMTAIGNLKS